MALCRWHTLGSVRDLDITGTLQRAFGHNLMGIYAEVVEGGDIALGDELVLS